MAGEAKIGRVRRKQCVEDHEEAWELSPDALKDDEIQGELSRLQSSLDHLKKQGVLSFKYGAIIEPGRGLSSRGYPTMIEFQPDRSYSGQELAGLQRHLLAPGWLLLECLSQMFPDDVEPEIFQVDLEIDLGDEHQAPLVTGRVTTVRTDRQLVREPIRVM